MNILKRVLSVIAVLFLLLTAFGVFATKSGFFTVDARDYVISTIKKSIGKDVRIGMIELGIINNITVRNVSIPVGRTFSEGGEFAAIKSVIIRFNLLDLIRHRNLDRTLSKIIIDSPLVTVRKENGVYNLERFSESFAMPQNAPKASGKKGMDIQLPINRVFIEKGRVLYDDRDAGFISTVDDISGAILLKMKPPALSVTLNCRTKGAAKKNCAIDVDYYINSNRFRGSADIRSANLNDWGTYILPKGAFAVNGGDFSVKASFSGTELNPEKMKVFGFFAVNNGDIVINGSLPLEHFNAVLELNGSKAVLKKGEFGFLGGSGFIKGGASDLYTTTGFAISTGIEKIDLSRLAPGYMSGTASVYLKASGDRTSPTAEADFIIDDGSTVRGMEAGNVKLGVSYSGLVLKPTRASGTLDKAVISVKGEADFNKKAKSRGIEITAAGLNAAKLFGSKDVSGEVTLTAGLNSAKSGPAAALGIKSQNIKYSGNDIENIAGSFTFTEKKISGSVSMAYKKYRDMNLTALVSIEDTDYRVEVLRLRNAQNPLIDVTGNIAKKDNALDLKVTLKNIMISDLSIDYLEGKQVDGAASGSIIVKGSAAAPVVDMFLNAPALKVRGQQYGFNGGLHYGDNMIKITGVDFNGNLKGSGAFSLKKLIFDANFEVKDLNGDVVSELTGLKMFDKGVMQGKVVVKKNDSGYGGNISLGVGYEDGLYRSARLDVNGSNNVFNITKAEIKQKSGSLTAGGSFTVKGNEELKLDLNGKLDSYRINDRLTADCGFRHSSLFVIEPEKMTTYHELDFKSVLFNKKPQDDLEIFVSTDGDSIPALKAGWGQAYTLQGRVDAVPGREPFIDAQVQVKDADLYPVYMLLNNRDKGLDADSLVRGDFSFKGPVNGASFTGTISQEQGTAGVQGTVRFVKKAGLYAPEQYSVKYSAVNLDLKKFAGIFDPGFRETGRVNGSGEMMSREGRIASEGLLELTKGTVADFSYDAVTLDYGLKDNVVTVNKGLFDYKKTYVKLDGSKFEFKRDNVCRVTVNAQAQDYVLNGFKLNGNLKFAGNIDTKEKLKIAGELESDNFLLNRHGFKPFLLGVGYSGDVLSVKTIKNKGRTDLKAEIAMEKDRLDFRSVTAEYEGNVYASVSGFLSTLKNGESDLRVNVKDADPQMVNDLLGWDFKWTGKTTGMVKVGGNTHRGPTLAINITLTNGSFNDIPFDIGTGVITLRNDWVNLSAAGPIVLTREGKYEVKLGGKIPAPMSDEAMERMKAAEMDLSASIAGGDLCIIKFLNFIEDAYGQLDGNLTIRGTKEFPSVSGRINVTDATVKLKYLFKELTGVYANILIKDNVMDIYSLKGDTERGTLKVENLNEKNGGLMKWLTPQKLNLKVTNFGDRVRVTDTKYMEFISGDADVDLEVTGMIDAPFIKGKMFFENGRIVFPIKTSESSGNRSESEDDYAKKITWDLSVTGGNNVRYYRDYANNYADATLKFNSGPIRVLDRGDSLKLYGTVGISKGTYKYLNTELKTDEMKASSVKFEGSPYPILDVYAKTVLRKFEMKRGGGAGLLLPGGGGMDITDTVDLNIYVRFWGRVGNINLDVTSEPSYNKEALVYIMTFGKAPEKELTREDAYKMVDVLANAWLKGSTEQLRNVLQLETVDIKTSGLARNIDSSGNTSNIETTDIEFGFGKSLGDFLYLEYRPKLVDITNQFNIEHTLGAEYTLDQATKFVMQGIIRDPAYHTDTFEGKISLEIGTTFESWGAKPTPTPVKDGAPR
ncbi:MAG: translocation/assembly module TamB domain-containing protein [Spirochaetia bacterium]|nr:translocation/assembly module TamB domain-containing protein [Spirochaetia bacterium]